MGLARRVIVGEDRDLAILQGLAVGFSPLAGALRVGRRRQAQGRYDTVRILLSLAEANPLLGVRLEQLGEFRVRGKIVLVTDYILSEDLAPESSDARVERFYSRVLAQGFVPYAAIVDRELDEVVVLLPEDWPVSQPPGMCPSAGE